MKYSGTVIFTDGSKHRRGAACNAAVILCNDMFLYEITAAYMDTEITADQMETEAICQAILWAAGHQCVALPPYRLYTDNEPFVNLYNGPNWQKRNGIITRAIEKGKEIGLVIKHIPAHKQDHNGNKTCDITCRALSGAVLRHGKKALSLLKGKAVLTDE